MKISGSLNHCGSGLAREEAGTDNLNLKESVSFEGIHQVMEGFTVGIVQPHEDLVRFEHLDPHHFF